MKLLFPLLAFFLLSGSASANPYFAVMDAGSGGTRLYVYKVTAGASGAPAVESIPVSGKKLSPGISTAINDCGPYIEPLLTRLNDTIKQQGIAESGVTVALLATAGMRVQSPLLQQHCYESVVSQISAQLPTVVAGPVQTIQGRYEGALEWLTVNHLNNALITGTKTKGVLEIGGGSYQMAFETRRVHPGTLDFITC